MPRAATTTGDQQPPEQPAAADTTPAQQPAANPPEPEPAKRLSTKAILAAVNDGADDDQDLIATLNRALYRFGAQDPSMELPRSWQRVQRRIGVDPDKLDGVATAGQVAQFAERTGLTLTR
ncbi:hypothetical protein [Micromonospora aurantiaca (nom. illeg.)]|uniref:hypothetical protein n=1 Tax=Micromonospora aurantiaca (nom. illeg.) TaxID=47850 RepID=UPI003F4A2B71